jgi:hypothetical protein
MPQRTCAAARFGAGVPQPATDVTASAHSDLRMAAPLCHLRLVIVYIWILYTIIFDDVISERFEVAVNIDSLSVSRARRRGVWR